MDNFLNNQNNIDNNSNNNSNNDVVSSNVVETLGEIPNVNQNTVVTNSEKIVETKKNMSKKLLIPLGILIVILVSIFLFLILATSSPKNVYTGMSDVLFGYAKNLVNKETYPIDEPIIYKGDLQVSTSMDELEFLNKEQINYSMGMDIKNKQAQLMLGLNENNKELVKLMGSIQNNNIYLSLGDLFTKNILVDNKLISEELGMSINEIFTEIDKYYNELDKVYYIVDEFSEISNHAFGKLNYEKEKGTINASGKNISTNKMILPLNKENIITIVNIFIDETLNNEELITKICDLIGVDKKLFKEELQNAKTDIASMDELEDKIEIIVYTEGLFNKVVKLSIEENSNEVINFTNLDDYKLLVIDTLRFEISNNTLAFSIDNETLLTGTVKAIESDLIDVTFKATDGGITGTFKYAIDKNKVSINFTADVEIDEGTIKLDVNNVTNMVSDKEINNNLVAKLSLMGDNFELKNNNTMLIGTKLSNIDTNNTINVMDITESDLEVIENNFMNKLKSSEFNALIEEYTKKIEAEQQALNGFVEDANKVIEAGQQVMLIKDTTIDGRYNFSVSNLIALGYLPTEFNKYQGYIVFNVRNGLVTYIVDVNDGVYHINHNDIVTTSDVYYYGDSNNNSNNTSNIWGDLSAGLNQSTRPNFGY